MLGIVLKYRNYFIINNIKYFKYNIKNFCEVIYRVKWVYIVYSFKIEFWGILGLELFIRGIFFFLIKDVGIYIVWIGWNEVV